MKNVDIMEAITNCIENKILKEWRHEGFIDQMLSDGIRFEIDGKKYTIELIEHNNEN